MEYKNTSISSNTKVIKNPLHLDDEHSITSSMLDPTYESIDNLLINDYISGNNLIK